MRRNTKIFWRSSLLLASLVIAYAAAPAGSDTTVDSHTILAGLHKGIAGIKTLTYTMVYKERLDEGKIHVDSSFVKYQRAPHRIYMKMSDGAEILWGAEVNNGNAYVHPNSFPFLTLELDPDGAIMRKNQHHGVEHAGYDYFDKVLEQAAAKAGKKFDSYFLYLGEIDFEGKQCYNVEVIDPEFKYVPYVVLKGETVMTIAQKLWLNEYMIMAHNNLSSYTDVTAGQTIMVPSNYGKLMTLYIDKTLMLPLLLRVDDEKGLFEQYIFEQVKLNPALAATEFSKDNKDYHF